MRKIYGLYTDDDILSKGAQVVVDKGVQVSDVFSPFPIHGIENIIGMKWTRLAICSFIYGLSGMLIALSCIWYFMGIDWPMIIGGKPNMEFYQNVPSFIPITFEFTVFCAAHGMAITYFIRNWIFPGAAARNPDPRTTDAHFALEIDPAYNPGMSKQEIVNLIASTGPVEIFEKYMGETPIPIDFGKVKAAPVAKVKEVKKAATSPGITSTQTKTDKKSKTTKDDLTKIEGIGPKIKSILHGEGIPTFADLAETPVERLKSILDAQGPRYRIHNPKTWPTQAGLAAQGKWEELKKLQDELNGGK